MDIRKQIQKIEREACRGEYGAWRKNFCRNYREVRDRICRQASHEQLLYLDSIGASISCRRGCAFCCSQYISVPLAHGLVIADYLYTRNELIEPFMLRFEKWQRVVSGSAALQALEQYTTFSPQVRQTPQELLKQYALMDVPCPFLVGHACVIYAVRPICCASHVSVTPPEICRPENADQALISEATPSTEGLRELAQLGERELFMHQETLPRLVYRMLTQGLPEICRRIQDCGAKRIPFANSLFAQSGCR